ncbi:hypothetical protein FQA39_LY02349 [Lamprigera yunnana]|nr:hypothetical protein FQA39_LY02349 [Lamprigera yunnana]
MWIYQFGVSSTLRPNTFSFKKCPGKSSIWTTRNMQKKQCVCYKIMTMILEMKVTLPPRFLGKDKITKWNKNPSLKSVRRKPRNLINHLPEVKGNAIWPKTALKKVGNSRIIGGKPAEAGEFPFQVINRFETFLGTSFCGGSLIASRWILTAAHCVYGASSFEITLGTLSSTGNDPNAVQRKTTTGIAHEEYNSYLLWNDIALVAFEKDVEYTDLIEPIQLGSHNIEENDYLHVSGWGKTSDESISVSPVLNWVSIAAISNEECASVYGSTITDKTLCCVGFSEHSPCNGDSGGPLFQYHSDIKPFHVGVVSFGHIAGCEKGQPSGFSRTSSYISWIESHTGTLEQNIKKTK